MTNYPTGDIQNEVLRAILVKNGRSYVTELNSYLVSKLHRDLLTPQIQVALKRLEQRELIVFLGKEKPERGGNWRKVYALTDAGRQKIASLSSDHDPTPTAEGGIEGLLQD